MSTENTKPTNYVENLLPELDGGVFIEKLGVALADVALAVTNTGKNGKVVVTFDVKQISATQVQINHQLKYLRPTQRGKVSEENTTATPLHVGARGKLTIFPDTQTELFKKPGVGNEEARKDEAAGT